MTQQFVLCKLCHLKWQEMLTAAAVAAPAAQMSSTLALQNPKLAGDFAPFDC
jgi:hypothetical protein